MSAQEHEPFIKTPYVDLRYGMSVPDVLREIDSPFFEAPDRPEIPPLDPNDRVFYRQFLTDHFREERSYNSLFDAGLDLYNGFCGWKKKALHAVDPRHVKSDDALSLSVIFQRLNIADLLRSVQKEVDFALDPQKPNLGLLFECSNWVMIEQIVECAVVLDELVRGVRAKEPGQKSA